MPIKAIIFDVDDTLIDWSQFDGAWEQVEAPHLHKVHAMLAASHDIGPVQDFITAFSKRVQQAWARARATMVAPHLGRLLVDAAVAVGVPDDAIDMRTCLDAYDWGTIPGTTPFPDAAEALAQLKARGLKLGIITNSFHTMPVRDRELDAHGLLHYFQDCPCRYTAADIGHLKPHPAPFEEALTCLKVAPEEAVYVGDSLNADVFGAQNVGMRAVLRVVSRAALRFDDVIVPDAEIDSLLELPALLDAWDAESAEKDA